MKARFKIGMLVAFIVASAKQTGIITGIVTRAEGHAYEIDSHEGLVDDKDIVAAYREVKERQPRAKKGEKKAKKVKKSASTDEAQSE